MDANHYNYAYAHLLYMMQNNNFYLKVVGECVNDEPTIIAIDEMVVEYYTQDMVEEEQIEDMDIPD